MLWGGDEMVYNVRVDENDWARCGYCGHKLFEVLGRMGDIRIKCHSCKNINITERRACETCKWLDNGVCMNDASIMFLQQKADNQACSTWERNETVGRKRR